MTRHASGRRRQDGRCQQQPAQQRAHRDRGHLPGRTGQQQRHRQGRRRQRQARQIRCQAAPHVPQRLRHHGGGGQLEAMQPGRVRHIAQPRQDQREQRHQQRRRQGEADPGRHQPGISGAALSQHHRHLAGGRSRQELAEADDGGIFVVTRPAAAFDELAAKIADMRHRAAETGQAQAQEDQECFQHGGVSARFPPSPVSPADTFPGCGPRTGRR